MPKEPVEQKLECTRSGNNAYFYNDKKQMRVSIVDEEGYLPAGTYTCETSPIGIVSLCPFK